MKQNFIFSFFIFLLFSSLLWMNNTQDIWAWSIFNAAGILFFWNQTRQTHLTVLNTPWRILFLLFLLVNLLTFQAENALQTDLINFTKIICLSFWAIVFLSMQQFNFNKIMKWLFHGSAIFSIFYIVFFVWGSVFNERAHPNLLFGFLSLCAIYGWKNISLEQFEFKKNGLILAELFIILTGFYYAIAWGPMLCFFVGITIETILRKLSFKQKFYGFIVVAILFILLPFSSQTLGRKIQDPHSFERIQIWQDSLQYWKDHFWIGTGFDSFANYYPQYKTLDDLRLAPYAHNEFINLLCETGLLGGILYLCAIFILIKRIRIIDSNENRLAIAVFLASLLHSWIDFTWRYPPILLITLLAFLQLCQKERIEPTLLQKKLLRALTITVFLFTFSVGISDAVLFITRRSHQQQKNWAQKLKYMTPLDPRLYYLEGSFDSVQKAIRMDPRNIWWRRELALAYTERFKISAELVDGTRALELYHTIIALAPTVEMFQNEKFNLEFLIRMAPRSYPYFDQKTNETSSKN